MGFGDHEENKKVQIPLKTTLMIIIISEVLGTHSMPNKYCINEEMLGQEKLFENVKQ